MPIPANLLAGLHSNAAIAHTAHTQIFRANISHQTNLGRAITNRRVDEPTPTAAASTHKVLRLPKFTTP